MTQILKRALKYKKVSEVLCEGESHLRDPYSAPPTVVKPPTQREIMSADDITDFPHQKSIPLPEAIPYPEGKYRPASVPYLAGYYPYNMYLQRGKVFQWCSCGISSTNPWCDSSCNSTATRNRPIMFNVNESGYYKMCNCKQSANAPFCNGTHRHVMRYYHSTQRGFVEIWGYAAFLATSGFMVWNFYQ